MSALCGTVSGECMGHSKLQTTLLTSSRMKKLRLKRKQFLGYFKM